MTLDAQKLKRYLLGDLPPQDIEEIDLKIISESDFEDELALAESDLIEEFLEGQLSESETNLFYKNFLVNDERNHALSEISLLKEYSKNSQTSPVLPVEGVTFGSYIRGLLKGLRPRYVIPAAIAALLIAFGIYWNVASFWGLTEIETEYVEMNTKDLGNLDEYTTRLAINLAPGVFRDGQSPGSKVRFAGITNPILFRLALPHKSIPAGRKFRIKVLRDQKVIFTQTRVAAYQNRSGHEIRFFLPSSIFGPGGYQLLLEDPTEVSSSSGVLYEFTFE